jgi:hypothetical protein
VALTRSLVRAAKDHARLAGGTNERTGKGKWSHTFARLKQGGMISKCESSVDVFAVLVILNVYWERTGEGCCQKHMLRTGR